MEFLKKLDLAILDGIFQKIVDWTQQTKGWTPVHLLRICCWASLIFLSIYCVADIRPMRIFAVTVLGLLLLLILHLIETEARKTFEKMLRHKVMNPHREGLLFPRILFFWTSTTGTLVSAGARLAGQQYDLSFFLVSPFLVAALWSLLAMYYFLACTPKPPRPLKAGNELATAVVSVR